MITRTATLAGPIAGGSLHLTIGAADFHFRAAPDVILATPAHGYDGFVDAQGERGASPEIEVMVAARPPPDLSGCEVLFDTEAAWALLGDERHRFLALQPAGTGAEPLWVARSTPDYDRWEVFCGPGLRSKRDGVTYIDHLVQYPLDQLLLLHSLARRGGLLIHAAGLCAERALVFAGPSGAGKSTVCRLLEAQPALRCLSDDRIVLRFGDAIDAYGTPWPGEAGHRANDSARLEALCMLRHGERTELRRLSDRVALERLLPVLSIPWYERELMDGALALVERLIREVPIFELDFQPRRDEVAQVIDELASVA